MTGPAQETVAPILSNELRELASAFDEAGTEDTRLVAARLNACADIAVCQEKELAAWRALKDVQTEQAGGVQ